MTGHLYVALADQIKQQIDQGIFSAGDRLPSVRRQSTQHGVSISTVLQAYGQLQDRRIIEPRPQSGYFVLSKAKLPARPRTSTPSVQPTEVNIGLLAMEVLRANSDPGFIPFGTALPSTDFPAIKRLHKILGNLARQSPREASTYCTSPGHSGLRIQLAKRAIDSGCSLHPDQILITNGCQEALVLALRAVAKAGDTIAIDSPCFYGTLQAIESLGMKALEIPTHPETGISLEALQLAVEQWPVKACLLTLNYSNPLGCAMPDSQKQTLMDLLVRHDLPLIEDDIYGEMGFDSRRPKSLKSFDRDGRVLLCSSISKTLDPGMRIGWISAGRYQERVEHLKLVSSMATATLPQMALAQYLEQGGFDRHLGSLRTQYKNRRDLIIQSVAETFPDGTRVTRPEGGIVIWIELPDKVDAMTLYRQAQQEGISIAPGPLFSPSGRYKHHIRLNYARFNGDRCEQAITTLARLSHRQI